MVGLTLLLGGCALFQSGIDSQNAQPTDPLTIDEKYLKIAQSVPGFGGMFIDQTGTLNVYLTDQMQIASAQSEIAAVFGNLVPQANVKSLKGDYNFVELKRWSDKLLRLFDIQGVILTDIDDTQNRLKVGVEDLSIAGQVEQALAKLGVPRVAVNIEQTEPIIPVVTLRDRVRPILAGLQINFPGFLCSLGFNAVRAGVNGFVTASHCTNTQGGVESTPYWQPLQTVDPVQIGTETVDPAYTKANCTGSGVRGNKRCRWSDSAFAAYSSDPSVTYTLGAIEKTSSVNTGSLTIAGSFRVTTKATTNAPVGTTLNKVGRTTGWSQGNVNVSCANVGVSGTNIVQRCQDQVVAAVGGGDSGSDVFQITHSPSADDVKLYGVLWGGNSSGTLFVYSPMSNVERSSTELGPLSVCASGFSC
jgi:hypothetical protein